VIIDAGKLDRRVELLTKTTTRDAAGQPIDAWIVSATVPAQRLNLRSTDIRSSAGVETVPDAKYLIRWRAGVTTAMRATIDGITYSVVGVDEPDRRATLVLTLQGV
jgi:SPP1 family predicted phage head-tail adaptor